MPYTDKEAFGATEAKRIDDDVGFWESAFAGVATGLINIPKGFVSVGAELYDLLGDTNTAAEVDKWFDDVNPFDDEAEARAVGKITQAITQIAPLAIGGAAIGATKGVALAAKMTRKAGSLRMGQAGAAAAELGYGASKLTKAETIAKKALAAKKAGKLFSLNNTGRKIVGPISGGIVGSGLGEAIVTDEDIGTLADIAKGTSLEPYALTMLDRDTKEGREDAYRRLKNRLKFGTEGALFNLGLYGAGKGIKTIRKPIEEGVPEYIKSPVGKFFQQVKMGLSPIGAGGRKVFNLFRSGEDNLGAIKVESMDLLKRHDEIKKDLLEPIQEFQRKNYINGTPITEKEFAEQLFDISTTSNKVSELDKSFVGPVDAQASLLKPASKTRAIKEIEYNTKIQQDLSKSVDMENQLKVIDDQLKDIQFKRINNIITEEEYVKLDVKGLRKKRSELLNGKYDTKGPVPKLIKPGLRQLRENPMGTKIKRNVFKVDDYQVNRKLEKVINLAKKSGVKQPVLDRLKSLTIEMRQSIDNMTSQLAQTGKLNKEALDTFKDDLGGYYSASYEQFSKLSPFRKHQVNMENFNASKEMIIKNKVDGLKRNPFNYKTVNGKQVFDETVIDRFEIASKAEDQIEKFLKEKGTDVSDVTGKKFEGGTKEAGGKSLEVESTLMEPGILTKRFAEPWQKKLLGEIKDPNYNYYATVNRQAHLLSGLRFVDEVDKALSVGPNKKIFTEAEMLADETRKANMSDPSKWKQVKTETGNLKGLSPLEGKFIPAPMYDEIFKVSNDWINKTQIGMAYRYMILAPKAISQISKTVLSGTTHVRNFLSAAAFAAGNGAILPNLTDIQTLAPKALGGKGALGDAYALTGKRLFGTITKEQQQAYKNFKRLGIVGTQTEVGETLKLTDDLVRGELDGMGTMVGAKAYRKLSDLPGTGIRGLKKTYGKIQDTYVAEDDFWKMVTFGLERNRYDSILNKIGVNKGNYKEVLKEDSARGKYLSKIIERKDIADESFDGFLDELSATMVRNQVPNYEYIGRTGKALRMSPFGNFIAFPLEVMRTGNNIIEQSIREITSEIPEIKALGYRRLFGFGTTVGGIPLALTETFKAKNNVTNEEMNALRRFVPEWSKNSTLLPIGRDENGYLKYIDFSYTNAYDFLLRPYKAVLNGISQGDGSEESLKQLLASGMQDGISELMQPFASESIFTEALIDSTIRGGIGKGGKKVWSEADAPMSKIAKGVFHIGETLLPTGSIKQAARIGKAARGKTDEYGRTFELANEINGIWGFRGQSSDPEKALIYMTTKFGRDLKNDENLFTSPLLKGGRVTPEDITTGYKYSESRRFATLKDMYKNIDAARTLGVSNSKIRNRIKRKGLSAEVTSDLMLGVYTPKKPSDFFKKRIGEINRDLNQKEGVDTVNPYITSIPDINQIINNNRRLNLLEEAPAFFEENEFAEGGRVGMQEGTEDPQENNKKVASKIWIQEPEEVKKMFEYDFREYFASGVWMKNMQQEVQPEAPSNTNPIVNSKIAPSTVAQLGAPGTNTNLTQPLKVEDVFKTGIV